MPKGTRSSYLIDSLAPDTVMQNPQAAGQSADASRRALEWLAILESDHVSEKRLREFRCWVERDAAHRAAWKEAQSFWSNLDRLPAQDVEDILAIGDQTSENSGVGNTVVPFRARTRQNRPAQDKQTNDVDTIDQHHSTVSRKPGRRRAGFALAAVLLLASGLWIHNDPAFYADHYTRVGEQRSLALTDGSIVQLNTDTTVSLDFAPEIRRVILHRGEAYFSVAADAQRPFEVSTDFGTVRALGTAFSIRTGEDAVRVTVFQHAVSIRAKNGATLSRLEQGRQIHFSKLKLGAARPVDLHREGAWLRQQLVFEDRPLEDVVRELNRYRPGWIGFVDARAAAQRVTGSIDVSAPDRALQSLIESLPISGRRIADRWVFLYSRSSDC